MTQFSDLVLNAALDGMEAAIGASPILKIYDLTGGPPANTSASIVGTVLATMALPADAMTNAAGAAKSLSGLWQDISADAAGVADFYRVFANDGITCHEQGTVTITGAGGNITVNNVNFAIGQTVTVTSKTWTAVAAP